MVIEKGQLLSYAFAEFGTENEGGELIAKEDLVVTPRAEGFPRFVKFNSPNPVSSCRPVVLMRAHTDEDGQAASFVTAELQGYYRFTLQEVLEHDAGATDADVDAFLETAVGLYRRDESLRKLRQALVDALVQSEERGGFQTYPPLPKPELPTLAAEQG